MPLLQLDHVNLRTANVAELADFYCDVLGLVRGLRPPFPFGGAWLYCGDHAVIHLVEVPSPPVPGDALRLEHFAFVASGYEELLEKLASHGITYRVSKLIGSETRQVNVRDPDGNRVHIDFPDHLAK